MYLKNILGERYDLDVNLSSSFEDITVKYNQTYNQKYKIIYIFEGRTLDLKSSPEQHGLTNQSTVYIVFQPPKYMAEYTGKQLRQAMKKNTFIMLNVISLILSKDSDFIDILKDAEKAEDYIDQILDQEDFKIKIDGETVADDPIKPYILHPCGLNGYEIDIRNLDYIIEQCHDLPRNEESLKKAKEIYLLFDRDIKKTIYALNNPEALFIGIQDGLRNQVLSA